LAWLSCPLLVLAGPATANGAEPPEVPVCRPVTRTVTDVEDFTGRLAAAVSVEVRARVSGYLLEAPFKEGSEVKKGDVLFTIDPRPYQAELDRATAEVRRAEARLERLNKDIERARATA